MATEIRNILYKNTIKYLHDLTEKVPNTLNILKSYYASKFRISELQTNIHLEESKNKLQGRCPRCCLKLSKIDASHFVKPALKRPKFVKKLLKKTKQNKRLTKFQAKYLKKNKLIFGNQLVLKCNFCDKNIVHTLAKPVRRRVDVKKLVSNKNRKVKKRKDKFCGLEREAVVSAQTQKNVFRENKTLNNHVSKRKIVKEQKKNKRKLCEMLNQNLTSPPKSGLTKFLMSL